MLEITCNDRLGKKVRVKCNLIQRPTFGGPGVGFDNELLADIVRTFSECSDDTIGDLKKLVAAQTGTKAERIILKKWYTIFKDHITIADYEIHDGMNLELYYS